jgi:formylglycine-generating enzyme required for sulfatase activity
VKWAAPPLVAMASSGCWLALGLDDNEYGRSGTITVDASTPFAIDATEVTMKAYMDWVASGPDVAAQEPRCSPWNDSFVPGVASAGIASGCTGTTPPETEAALHPGYPARCVDWCDAMTYCNAHGARLCGAVGGGPLTGDGSTVADLFSSAATSEWFAACTGPEGRAFPYGASADADACRDSLDALVEDVADVGTPTCEGGVAGLFDMSGNVDEWTDVCYPDPMSDEAHQVCFRGGGSYESDAAELLDCADDGTGPNLRANQSNTTGFRCCANP